MPGRSSVRPARRHNATIDTSWSHKTLDLPAGLCMFVIVRLNATGWTPGYRDEFEAFMGEFLVSGLREQTTKGAVLITADSPGARGSWRPRRADMVWRLRELGWSPGGTVRSVVRARANTSRACDWVVQSRVDADDYLGPDFVETIAGMVSNEHRVAVDGPGWCGGCGKGKTPPDAIVVSQPRLTRVYLFGGEGARPPTNLHLATAPMR